MNQFSTGEKSKWIHHHYWCKDNLCIVMMSDWFLTNDILDISGYLTALSHRTFIEQQVAEISHQVMNGVRKRLPMLIQIQNHLHLS